MTAEEKKIRVNYMRYYHGAGFYQNLGTNCIAVTCGAKVNSFRRLAVTTS